MHKVVIEPFGIKDCTIDSSDNVFRRIIEKYSYASDKEDYHIDYLEVLYQLYKKNIRLYCREKELGFPEFIKLLAQHNNSIWIIFSVYLDIRRRGRLVKSGVYKYSLLSEDGHGLKEYHIMEENRLIQVNHIEKLIMISRRNGRIPILAIVDRNGNATYYEVEKINFPNLLH